MPTVDYERLIWEDYPSEDTPINAENLNHLEEGVAGLYHDQAVMESEMTELSNKVGVLVGAPLVATLAVNMIDKSKVYVYTGSETGYTAGNWYYWDGTQWQSGGVYNSVAVNTDKTLTVEDMAADGKATGVRIKEEAKFNLLDLGEKTGNPIVLKDGGEDAPVKDLKVTLEPVQDLHGYGHPWPAGGGKNLLPKGESYSENDITFTVNDDGTIITSGTASAAAFWILKISLSPGSYILSGCPSGGGINTYRIDLRDGKAGTVLLGAVDNGNGVTFTVSEALTAYVNIRIASGVNVTGKVFKPMIRLSSISDATFAPYSNVCPITGMTEVNVERTGKNLAHSGFAWNVGSDGIVAEGALYNSSIVRVFQGQTYIHSVNGAASGIGVLAFFAEYPHVGSQSYDSSRIVSASATFTAPISGYAVIRNTASETTIQVELGSAATDYEPYKGDTYTTNLGRTVYSGVLDVTKGVLKVDRAIMTLGDVSEIGTSGTGTGKYVQWTLPSTGNSTIKPMSERMTGVLFAQRGQAYQCYLHTNNSSLQSFVPSDATVSSVNAALSGSKVLYHLATPLIYHLTPTEVTTLLEYNFISSDGRMELTYRRSRPAFFEREEMYNLLPLGDLSGNPAYCDDGADDVPVKDMSITIEPKQDLHGYDHPWPAGGGKNLVDADNLSPSSSARVLNTHGVKVVSGQTYTVSAKASASLNNRIYIVLLDSATVSQTGSGIGTASFTWTMVGTSSSYTLTADSNKYLYLWIGDAVGSFTMSEIQMEIGSAATSYAPYSNICPISGYESVDVVRCGLNIWDEEWEVGGLNTSTGAETGNTDRIRAKNYIKVIPNTLYNIHAPIGGGSVCCYTADKTYIGDITVSWSSGTGVTFTTPANCTYIRFFSYANYGATYNNDICINFSNQAKNGTYEPYKGDTYAIKLSDEAGTVYSGTLNPVTGDLVVDRVGYTFADGSGLIEGTDGNTDWLCVKYTAPSNLFDVVKRAQNICSHAPFTFVNANGTPHFYTTYNVFQLFVPKGTYSTLSAFTASLATSPLTLVAFLGTPITYHLDKEEITTLLGSNTFTTDAKTLDLTYRKDLGLYIKKLIETT